MTLQKLQEHNFEKKSKIVLFSYYLITKEPQKQFIKTQGCFYLIAY